MTIASQHDCANADNLHDHTFGQHLLRFPPHTTAKLNAAQCFCSCRFSQIPAPFSISTLEWNRGSAPALAFAGSEAACNEERVLVITQRDLASKGAAEIELPAAQHIGKYQARKCAKTGPGIVPNPQKAEEPD
jgi:hypothetical protein